MGRFKRALNEYNAAYSIDMRDKKLKEKIEQLEAKLK